MGIASQSLEEFIKTDREVFRAQATDALLKFTPDDRELAASLESDHTTTDDILRAWTEQIEPIHQELEAKRTDARFKKYLIRHMGFHDHQAERVIDNMIEERKTTLLDEVLANLYPLHDDTTYQRDYAVHLLTQSDADINDFMSRYIDFAEALDASNTYKVLLCDPHSSWLDRQRTALQIHKERAKTQHSEANRLDEIDSELRRLTEPSDSLLSQIVAKHWSFITILDLRAKYQKQVDELPKSDHKSPAKRLKLFERVTASFRDRETERLAHAKATHSLKGLRQVNEEVYNLLLEIFDLGTKARNQLLLDIQTHTRLSQERDLILLIQRNREHFLAAHD